MKALVGLFALIIGGGVSAKEPSSKDWEKYAAYSRQERAATIASASAAAAKPARTPQEKRAAADRKKQAQREIVELKQFESIYLARLPLGKPKVGVMGIPRVANAKVVQNLGDGSATIDFPYLVKRESSPRETGAGDRLLDANSAAGHAALRANVGMEDFLITPVELVLLKSRVVNDVADGGQVALDGPLWFSGTQPHRIHGAVKTILIAEPIAVSDEEKPQFTRAGELREWRAKNDKPLGAAVLNGYDGKVVELADEAGKPRRIQIKALSPQCQKVATEWLARGSEYAQSSGLRIVDAAATKKLRE